MGLPAWACLHGPATCHLPPAACHLPPAACHLPPATCHLPPQVLHALSIALRSHSNRTTFRTLGGLPALGRLAKAALHKLAAVLPLATAGGNSSSSNSSSNHSSTLPKLASSVARPLDRSSTLHKVDSSGSVSSSTSTSGSLPKLNRNVTMPAAAGGAAAPPSGGGPATAAASAAACMHMPFLLCELSLCVSALEGYLGGEVAWWTRRYRARGGCRPGACRPGAAACRH